MNRNTWCYLTAGIVGVAFAMSQFDFSKLDNRAGGNGTSIGADVDSAAHLLQPSPHANSDVELLRREVSALQHQLADLKQLVTDLADTAIDKAAEPITELSIVGEPVDELHARQQDDPEDLRQAMLASYEFAVPDLQETGRMVATVQQMQSELVSTPLEDLKYGELECRATLCRIEFQHADQVNDALVAHVLSAQLGRTGRVANIHSAGPGRSTAMVEMSGTL